jgi:cyclopropane fatty-acyl-phospholipid synthase-like methyltransferase
VVRTERDSRAVLVGSDAQFYLRRHQMGGIPIGGDKPLDAFERTMFTPGARYHLVAERLQSIGPHGGHLVEIGCGGGEALLVLASKYSFARVTGIDVATLSAGHHGSGIELLTSNLNEDWPFANGEVDYLIAMMVLEHLFDPFHSFREIKRILSKNGEAYVNLPLVTAWRNRARLLFGRLPVTSSPYLSWFQSKDWDGGHLHYFSVDAIESLATASGLRATDIRGVGKFSSWKTRWPRFLASEVTFRLRHDI